MTSDIGGPPLLSSNWDPNCVFLGQGRDEGDRVTLPKGDTQSTDLHEARASQRPVNGVDKENAMPVGPPTSDGRRASPAKGGTPLLRRMVYSPPPALRPTLFSPLWAAPPGSPTSSDDLLNPMSTAAALDSWWIGGGVAALRPGGEGRKATTQDGSGSEGGDGTSETGEERGDAHGAGWKETAGQSGAAPSSSSTGASEDQEAGGESTVREAGRQGTEEPMATPFAGLASEGLVDATGDREEQGLRPGSEGVVMVRGMINDLVTVVAEDSQLMAVAAAGSGGKGRDHVGSTAMSQQETWGGGEGAVRSSAGGSEASEAVVDASLSAVLPGEGKGMEVGEGALASTHVDKPTVPVPSPVPDTAATPGTPADFTAPPASTSASRGEAEAVARAPPSGRPEAGGYDVSVRAVEPDARDVCGVGWLGLLSCGPGGHSRPYVAYRITVRWQGGAGGGEEEMSTVKRYSELLIYHHLWSDRGLVPRHLEHPFPPKPSPFAALQQPNSQRVVPSCAFVQRRRRQLQAYLSDLLTHANIDLWQDPLFRSMFE